jgi:sodium-dependent phosphate transporter
MLDSEYLWIPILGGFVTFFAAWGIGANDVANSFATSVGAKVLSLRHAVVIAGVFEFLGAFLMGSHVTKTIRKNIVDIDIFEDEPELLMFGMLSSLFGIGIWLMIATYMKAPVSTTHSAIGAIIGFALVAHGKDAVDWETVYKIVISWFISPFFAGLLSALLFIFIKYAALVREDPVKNMLRVFPFLVFLTTGMNAFFIIYKGTPVLELDDTPLDEGIYISIGVGVGCALLTHFVAVPILRKWVNSDSTRINCCRKKRNPEQTVPRNESSVELTGFSEMNTEEKLSKVTEVSKQLKVELDNEKFTEQYKHSRVFCDKSEKLFSQLQVFTACFSAFAHGANDVANAIGPYAAVIAIYKNGSVSSKSDVPIWILALGGVGIVIGLLMWGYKIIERIGKELTRVTPSRGFSIELASAATVVIASRLEMPISTTHSQVGAVIGCGLVDGHKNVKWKTFCKIIASWLITLPIAGAISAAIYSFGVYSPRE